MEQAAAADAANRLKAPAGSAAVRVNPRDFFTQNEWAFLTARSRWRGLWLVLHCWAVIGLAMAIGVMWPIAVPVMVMVIGNRQLGLFVLMHEAAHGLQHPHRALNDTVGRWLCGAELDAYRPYHLQHHRFVQQARDPDLVLSAPFPVSRASLCRKMIRDLTGQTFFKQRWAPLKEKLRSRTAGDRAWRLVLAEARSQRVFLLCNAVGLIAFSAAGLGWAWWAMWLLPMVSWLPLISRLRNIAEHALVAQHGADPLRHALTTHASALARALVAPYWVNFHSEHHLFTPIPCWNLQQAHRLLADRGVTRAMEVQPGYLRVLALATARPAFASA